MITSRFRQPAGCFCLALWLALICCAVPLPPAQAANGAIYINSCACKTTSDYTTVAEATVQSRHTFGNFTIVSTSQASTAVIRVTGNVVQNGSHSTFEVTSAVPIDGSGNSLASEPESELEAFYTAYDLNTFNASRADPIWINSNNTTVSLNSFIGSSDSDVGSFLNSLPITGAVPFESVVLITFKDGSSAMFQYTGMSTMVSGRGWTWVKPFAWNKSGQQIDRSGNLLSNPNTSGTGGGSISVPAFSSGSEGNFMFTLGGAPDCVISQQIEVDTGSDSYVSDWANFSGPC